MFLSQLHITNFKNLRNCDVTFDKKINCFVGFNGMGKTNLLDAIYTLAVTKSKFNYLDKNNITTGETLTTIKGRFENDECTYILATRGGDEPVIKTFLWNQKSYERLYDHIGKIPVLFFIPQDINICIEGELRRKFMDSILSQRDRNYLSELSTYNRLVKQRNSWLKTYFQKGLTDYTLFEALDDALWTHAQKIFQVRKEWSEIIIERFTEIYHFITDGTENIALLYNSTLANSDMRQDLRENFENDIRLGRTSIGIHRDDLVMLLDGQVVRWVGSQGQQKTFIVALQLAQIDLLREQTHSEPILLIDDIFDKLDSHRIQRIIEYIVSHTDAQLFITHTDEQQITNLFDGRDYTLFNINNGQVK